ncbi:MAG: glutamyl-tRNA reductase [Gemmatimonadales bacterium]
MIEAPSSSGRAARLCALTINHRSAPLEDLEQVALSPAACEALGQSLLRRGIEGVPLSTCHRTELYWESRTTGDDAVAEATLRSSVPGPWPGAGPTVQRLQGEAAIRHLFRVAAGVESVLVGEAEVVGQIRRALELAHSAGVRSPLLTELFHDALRFGRLVRSRTRIGQGALSIASAAVQLISGIQDGLEDGMILVVGAGKVGQKVVRHLRSERVRCVLLNRTLARAQAAAQESGVVAAPLSDLPAWLARARAVVVAAQAESRVITADMMRAVRQRTGGGKRPIVIMDASMPRAVDPEVAAIPGVILHDLSGLEAVVEQNRVRREAEIPRVEALLEDALRRAARREQRRLEWERSKGARRLAG